MPPLEQPTLDRLLLSAAKSIARLPVGDYDATLERLQAAASMRDFAATLEGLDWGMAPEAKRSVIAALDDATWEDARGRLLRSLDHQRIERMSPSS